MNYNKATDCLLKCLCAVVGLSFAACKEDSPDIPAGDEKNKTTVLLYAVASNNLYGNLIEDKEEILTAAKGMQLNGLTMLVYQVTPEGEPSLLELTKMRDGTCSFKTVKEYDRTLYSTDPRRINQVIEYVMESYDSDKYGLVLWSHGTGWDPTDSTHPTDGAKAGSPMMHSFGSDKDIGKNPHYYDEINIDELADAIPDGSFHFIWFDACYMSGIEAIYELRDKCRYFVGYPTEVYTPGMPYDKTLPYILNETPDLVGGAGAFFKYYAEYPSSSMRSATVTVVDTDKIDAVADCCKGIYAGGTHPSPKGLLRYTRGSVGPFYDFRQYTGMIATDTGISADELNARLDDMVLYTAATEVDFNKNPIPAEVYSGISCHLYNSADDSKKNEYYRKLDWYKRVYPNPEP